ncbi:MAG: RagB/SusD family nutrient uptake outer membrane protein [Clostridium sp.]|nr:RagB/SusD family nutrient uptake outer membrane protein [Bacteroides sp.]MCM1198457.1 RagB/SusD family nutrient uptake outer membrane protein [Clostridium sp.]
MGKIRYILPLMFAVSAVSCDMDPELELQLTEEDVIHTYNNTMGRANAVYTYLPDGFSYIGGAMLASACDEAEHTSEGSSVHKFNTGSWSYLDNPDGAWNRCFGGIYTANLFLEKSDDVQMDYLKYDPDQNEQAKFELYMDNIEKAKLEVRFLRALYYFELVERYGGVPVLERTYGVDDDYSGIGRNTLEECIGFIVNECDDIAPELPAVKESGETGRVTKGAALALKSRALLFAASDLFNDPSWAGGYDHPELISMPGDVDRKDRWDAAAQAAKAVLDLSEARYTLMTSYPDIFLKSYSNNEAIFVRRYGSSYSFEESNYPIGFDKGNSGTTPSQNLVDAFETKTGKRFDWSNPDMAGDPYANRDPRLAYAIITNGSSFKDRTMEIFEGGRDGKGIVNATRTGYYLRKYVDPDANLLQGRGTVHAWIIFRLAEMYLNYAEAMNEAYGPSDAHGYGMTAIEALNKIRQRKGVDMPAVPSTVTKDEMRERIRNERRVELAFEGHRMFDVRRWMIAEETLGAPLRGVDIRQNSQTYIYTPQIVENRTFETRMYLFPIPQSDLNISGWPQNPLW